MRLSIPVMTIVCAGCQAVPSDPQSALSPLSPLSLANDYRVAPAPGVRRSALTEGDGPGGAHVVFLNFDGASILPSVDGYTDDSAQNRSWMASSTRTIPAFDATPFAPQYTHDSAIAWIVNQYKKYYAAYNVSVTTTRPASGRYTMVMIGGSPSDLNGGGGGGSEAGVSPLDCGNQQETNIAFSFAKTLSPNATGFDVQSAIKQIADDAAHESGHSFGAEHTVNMADIMYPTLTPEITGFGGEADLSDGASQCSRGATTQNTAAVLLANLGAATSQPVSAPPQVAFSAPADGASVGLTFDVTVSASAAAGLTLTKVEISTGAQLFTLTSAPYSQAITVAQPGGYTLTATAYDNGGNSAAATIHVTASSGATPMPSSPPDMSMGPAMQPPTPTPSTPPSAPPSPSGDGTGQACSTALSCQSGLCISGVCSERCDPAHPGCPAGWTCGTSGGAGVCLPPSSDAGCSAARGTPSPGWPALLLALLLVGGRRRLRR
jgi:hypothetical protein